MSIHSFDPGHCFIAVLSIVSWLVQKITNQSHQSWKHLSQKEGLIISHKSKISLLLDPNNHQTGQHSEGFNQIMQFLLSHTSLDNLQSHYLNCNQGQSNSACCCSDNCSILWCNTPGAGANCWPHSGLSLHAASSLQAMLVCPWYQLGTCVVDVLIVDSNLELISPKAYGWRLPLG